MREDFIDKNVREALLSDITHASRPPTTPVQNTYWRYVVLCMACVVVFATSFAQTNPESV